MCEVSLSRAGLLTNGSIGESALVNNGSKWTND